MSLIIAAPAAIAARMTAGLRVSTPTGTPSAASASTSGMTRASSTSSATGLGAGARRFAADVDDVGAVVAHLPRVRQRLFPVGEATTVGEGIRRDVEDAHHERARKVEREGSATKDRGAHRYAARRGSAIGIVPANQAGVVDRRGTRCRARRPVPTRSAARLRGLRRARRPAGHDVVDLVGVDRLELEQRGGHRLDLVAIVLEELPRDRVLLVDDLADLAVDLAHRLLRHVDGARDRPAEEDFALVLAVDHRAHQVGHAVARDHVAGDVRRALEVVRRARRHLVHEELFGDPAAEQHGDDVQHVLAVHAVAVLLRQLHRHAQRPPARNDRDLVHGVGLGQEPARRSRDPTRDTRCCAARPRA